MLLWLLERTLPKPDPDDVALLAPRGGCYRHAMVEGDDLWISEAQVAWWLEVGLRLREYAAHWPECRATDDHDLRCGCGLLEVLGSVDEAVACTMAPDDTVADLLAARPQAVPPPR